MNKLSMMLTIAAVTALAASGCKKEEKSDARPETAKAAPAAKVDSAEPVAKVADAKPGEVEVDALESMISTSKVSVFDANGKSTRESHGKIPTATLLSHFKDYELSELPTDKASKLVFYCSNTQCGAAPTAAKKALAAGYTDVNVLPVGVMGWKEAGKKTEKI